MLVRQLLVFGFLILPIATAVPGEVVSLTLIDADRDRPVRTLSEGDTIELGKVGSINIRADVKGKVGSVRFGVDGRENQRTENVPPFALAGESDGDYNVWDVAEGEHTLTATPYPEAGAQGTPGKAMKVRFKVVSAPSRYPDIAGPEELGRIAPPTGGEADVQTERKRWHNVVLDFTGPASSETARPNPFLHYRLNVTFTRGDTELVVPGCFVGDGEGGDAGNVWRVHFSPPETGTWEYEASFRAGYQVNISLDPEDGQPTAFDGAKGSFEVADSDKNGQDFRSSDKGLLRNRGHHYLTFGGSGDFWVKGGPDIPESFLGYDGFDNTPAAGHQFEAHAVDWRSGDPDWGDGQGKRIIGALNYIADQGGNCIYFLPMNIGGDGKDTFPTIEPREKTRYDLSKLRQWETVFAHAQSLGIFLHFQLAEEEDANENYHDGGELGIERKLFYRELVARFGHHNGMQFGIGEENDYGTQKRIEFASYIRAVDPYDHPVATHTRRVEDYYDPLVAELKSDRKVVIDMASFQDGRSNKDLADLIIKYRTLSNEHGSPWVISLDEPQKIENDKEDEEDGYAHGRRDKMWPAYMSGAGGFEWYVQSDGGGHGFDQSIDDFREMDVALAWARHARDFLNRLPLLDMEPAHELGDSGGDGVTYVLAKPGDIYALYNDRTGEDVSLDLSGVEGTFEVRWFNPRSGGELVAGTIERVAGGRTRSLGSAPDDRDADWACLVRRVD